ncbi:Methyltransferase-like protein 27 [Dissostichus eleginoides]|uniref:Methyltransferase-like protein 27 n=1 Tax=Dissostichus eleginoides TaxID=100907 RepID=A0AAD9C5R5_DISEL|nr:Methyltransferase-like protein 27 [Dissostichus eleginoides]
MSDCSRTLDDVKTLLRAFNDTDPQQTKKLYDSWAETYDQDLDLLNYRAPHLAVDFLDDNFPGAREEVQVLDVACGSGLVAKLMVELGFRHFVGVDCSKGMLDQAAKTGRYQDLRLALLGSDPLPAQTGVFDVVIMVGGLDAGFAPVSVVRELCHTAKPGGFVCMARGDHRGSPSEDYGKDLQRELQLMEDEGLWSPAGHKRTLGYMQDPYLSGERIQDLLPEERFLSGTVFLYQKSIQ